DLALHLERRGELRDALDVARRAVAADALSEEANRDVIRISAALGEPAEGLRRYRELERALAKELGVAPSAAARALAEGPARRPSAAAVSATAPEPGPAPARAAAPSSTLPPLPPPALPVAGRPPLHLTRFFGRE